MLLEQGENLASIEIKSWATIGPDFMENLKIRSMINCSPEPLWLIYGGNRQFIMNETQIIPWRAG
jgi:hypothetical protein